MSAKNDGGPAYPSLFVNQYDENVSAPDGQIVSHGCSVHMSGMSLRDAFAIAALPSIIRLCANDTMHEMTKANYFASRAYEIADAMIEARKS